MSKSTPLIGPGYDPPPPPTGERYAATTAEEYIKRFVNFHRVIEGHIYAIVEPNNIPADLIPAFIADVRAAHAQVTFFPKETFRREEFSPDIKGTDDKLVKVNSPFTAYAIAKMSVHNALVIMFRVRKRESVREEDKEKLTTFFDNFEFEEEDYGYLWDEPGAVSLLERDSP